MAGFRLQNFKGLRPRISSRLLPEGEGQISHNTRLESGDLEPWKEPSTIQAHSTSSVETIYRFRNGGSALWFEWTADVDVARGPILNDELERTYFTGDGAPKMTFTSIASGTPPLPDTDRNLGIPAPTDAITFTAVPDLPTGGTIGPDDISANSLQFTFIYNITGTGDTSFDLTAGDEVTNWALLAGTRMKVKSVTDSDNYILGPEADDASFILQGYNPEGTNIGIQQTWLRGNGTEQAVVNTADIKITELKINKVAHGLIPGDLIIVASVSQEPALAWEIGVSEIFDAEAFGAKEDVDGLDRHIAKDVWAAAAGAADFDIRAEFEFSVSRVGSDLDAVDSRAYVFTWVSDLGEEGPPSPPSAIIEAVDGDSNGIDLDWSAADANRPASPNYEVSNVRIYRTSTGSSSTEFQFLAEVGTSPTTYNDTILSTSLAEVLQTTTWDPPPTDMAGIIALPNGIMAGFTGKTVHLSEPYFPHAWPPEYQIAVDHEIVGMGVLPTGALVLTVGDPYVISGAHSRAMSLRHYEFAQACVSKRSIVNTRDTVLYASPDGLVSIGSSGFNILTSEYMEKRDWQAYNPDTMLGFLHDGRYYGFFDGGLIIISIKRESTTSVTGFNISTGSDVMSAGYVDAETDTLYISDGDDILAWDEGTTDKELTWKSAELRAPYLMNLGAGRIVASAYPLTLSLWADGILKCEITVKDDEAFRLPGGYLGDIFEFQFETDGIVRFAHFAETIQEIGEG